jgi:DNA ligase (NAD+)
VHFVSKPAFDIVSLGPNIIKTLLNSKLIVDASDLFTLKKGDLLKLEGFKDKASDNLINAIENSKQVTLPRFLIALSIKNVGAETANILADKFHTLENIMQAKKQDLENIYDIGEIVASSIYSFFKEKSNLDYIEKLFKNGVNIVYEEKKDTLKGLTFVLTGTLSSIGREKAKESIRKLGGSIASAPSSSTSYVVLGKNPGSKYEKAKQLGLKILNEKEFYELIKPS